MREPDLPPTHDAQDFLASSGRVSKTVCTSFRNSGLRGGQTRAEIGVPGLQARSRTTIYAVPSRAARCLTEFSSAQTGCNRRRRCLSRGLWLRVVHSAAAATTIRAQDFDANQAARQAASAVRSDQAARAARGSPSVLECRRADDVRAHGLAQMFLRSRSPVRFASHRGHCRAEHGRTPARWP